MEAYLDNAATTKPFPEVVTVMQETMEENYGNPSSMHQKGVDAEKYIRNARQIIAKSLRKLYLPLVVLRQIIRH